MCEEEFEDRETTLGIEGVEEMLLGEEKIMRQGLEVREEVVELGVYRDWKGKDGSLKMTCLEI